MCPVCRRIIVKRTGRELKLRAGPVFGLQQVVHAGEGNKHQRIFGVHPD